ncbi:MAG: 16S rRNA (adenine(1518)-N(6)/adenine(1519)-N(6))-dimethyltransferase RsmA [Hydrogenovibrio sp.]|uniref:16S rRNA (adenine(1518)-N(6)/adenine(1519)-N(6))- dimethyltransferase RsmA n=1 Tax=Hydrogenovibrio sp. TaxID=2065821 RepID=UPI00287045CC|nr:16S rRNA (adenine(1518)-N(6)/adenine(1519)-N(6))-dimethyltransferase RsmA [Hydrogenovibrio sp.]MDR9499488.1 16S rRNA (adenine(1518)-N(6)/adenine(1519)-N(6))-dimethyltransferase RsmA [Hydrogenovibrio sp.]
MSHQHKKQFGQNFLNNQAVVDRIVKAIAPRADDHLVEIGPGEAALTGPLLDRVERLDIIEIDRDLIPRLTQAFGQHPAFHLHSADALRFDYAGLVKNDAPSPSLRVVGNLPYNISSPLLFHLMTFESAIIDMHFMLQKEVVERICARPGSKTFGRLSVMMQYACETEHLFDVGPANFTPPPKVNSAIVRLKPRRTRSLSAEDPALLSKVVKQAFAQKRKTLRNNLKPLMNAAALSELGIDPSMRAEQLDVEAFVRISNRLAASGQDGAKQPNTQNANQTNENQ